MELKIGGKKYQMIFGLDAIDTLDRIYKTTVNGVDFGVGVNMLITYLFDGNPTALRNAIKAGTSTEPQKPSNEDIEQYLTEVAEAGKLEALANDFLNLLRTQPFTKSKMKVLDQSTGFQEAVKTDE